MMRTAIAILIGSAAIALAVLVTFHWDIKVNGQGSALRLNRWTGEATFCIPDPQPGAASFAGMKFKCDP